MEIVKGSLVRACAGRDKDSLFVAVGISGGFVYICDGKSRPLERPKRKNPKHISPAGKTIDMSELSDKSLRRLISEFKTQNEEEPVNTVP